MREYISFDSHKHYTLVEREEIATGRTVQERIEHAPGNIRRYLSRCEPGTPVAVEATANWYWIVTEIEEAGLRALLVHPRKAKLMLGMINKTDKLDVHGLNRLQRNGTLPTVWLPPAALREVRELTRARVALGRDRTRLKNRIQAMLAKYGLQMTGVSDVFCRRARPALERQIGRLPPQGRFVTTLWLEMLDRVLEEIEALEDRLENLVEVTPAMQLLRTLPGIGVILASATALEIGEVSRFPDAEHLAAYAGTVPRVHGSGDKYRHGRTRPDVNRHLKWALAEAANSVAVNQSRRAERYVSRRYRQVRRARNHSIAVGAVARHLAEAAYHVLTRQEPYREPMGKRDRGREAQACRCHTLPGLQHEYATPPEHFHTPRG
jgi:transposase